MTPRDEFLSVNSRRSVVKFCVLSANVASDGTMGVTFEVRGDRPECLVEMNGYLAVAADFATRARTTIELDATQCEDLIFFEYDHLSFRAARVTLTACGGGRFDLELLGEVIDPGAGNQRLAISARAETSLDQVSVQPNCEREARQVLARTRLPGEFLWTRMANGLWTFFSPRRAQSEAAFATLLPRVRALPREQVFQAAGLPIDRAALHASSTLLQQAKAALRAEVDRRWPSEVQALLPDAMSQVEQLLAI